MGDAFMRKRVKSRLPRFTYTGSYEVIDDGHGDWRVKFLSSGTLTFKGLDGGISHGIDVFLVGGGGRAARHPNDNARGHGGGGYTRTQKNVSVTKGTAYSITIGGSAADTKAFGYTAAKGVNARIETGTSVSGDYYWDAYGGNGGSGGAAYGGSGGTDGGNATGTRPGKGQISQPGPNGETGSTREFGEPDGKLYARGGQTNLDHSANTGNGGWVLSAASDNPEMSGCSGIVVIRNHRE